MAAYLVLNYDITDLEKFMDYYKYAPKVLERLDGEVLMASGNSVLLEGENVNMNVVLKFKDEDTVHAFYNDPEYEKAKEIRHKYATNHQVYIAKEYVPLAG